METSTHFCLIHFLAFLTNLLWSACSGRGRPHHWYTARLGMQLLSSIQRGGRQELSVRFSQVALCVGILCRHSVAEAFMSASFGAV